MTKQSDYVVVLNRKDKTGKAGEVMSYFEHFYTFANWDFVVKKGEIIDKFDKGDEEFKAFEDLPRITFDEWQNLPDCEPVQPIEPIYGYKLAKLHYYDAVRAIMAAEDAGMWFASCFDSNLRESGYNFKTSDSESSIEGTLRKAGVLEEWFEPVYESDIVKKDIPEEWPISITEDLPEPVIQFSNFHMTSADIEQMKRIINND